MTILYNGWPLAYQPNSPAALHMLTILSLHPRHIQAYLALPEKSFHPIPGYIEKHIQTAPNTASGRLRWEQRSLPKLAAQLDCSLIHHTTSTAALFGNTPQIISPTEILPGVFRGGDTRQSSGFAERLRFAAAQGGISRIRLILWPSDLPTPKSEIPFRVIPAIAPSLIQTAQDAVSVARKLDLPDDYFLYHGPASGVDLHFLASAWSRAANIIGEGTPLLVLSSDGPVEEELEPLREKFHLGDTLRSLPTLTMQEIALIYQGCRAVFHPIQVSAWGGPVRLALANTKPVIGFETPAFDALVGPAAYLVQKGGAESLRSLSAALITVTIEQEMADALATAAGQRASKWDNAGFALELERIYQELSQPSERE